MAREENRRFQVEIKGMYKIQNNQGRMLEKMTDENEFLNRIDKLGEELKSVKERNRDL